MEAAAVFLNLILMLCLFTAFCALLNRLGLGQLFRRLLGALFRAGGIFARAAAVLERLSSAAGLAKRQLGAHTRYVLCCLGLSLGALLSDPQRARCGLIFILTYCLSAVLPAVPILLFDRALPEAEGQAAAARALRGGLGVFLSLACFVSGLFWGLKLSSGRDRPPPPEPEIVYVITMPPLPETGASPGPLR